MTTEVSTSGYSILIPPRITPPRISENGRQAKDARRQREERQEHLGARRRAQVPRQRGRGRQIPRGAVAPGALHLRRLRLRHFPNHSKHSNGLMNSDNDNNSTNSLFRLFFLLRSVPFLLILHFLWPPAVLLFP